MVVIVEGIDRVGKTTLCNKLKDTFGGVIAKGVCYHTFDSNEETHKAFGEVLVNVAAMLNIWPEDKLLILDRFHLSHFTYGCLERGMVDFSSKLVDDMLANSKVLLILVRPTDIAFSSEKHGKDLSNHARLFELLINHTKLPIITTDYDSLDTCIENVTRYMQNDYKCI